MKYIIISNNYPPALDGVGDYTYHLETTFKNNGHDIFIICSKNVKNTSNPAENVFPIVDSWNSHGYKQAYKKIQQICPDWILVQYVPSAFNQYGMPLGMLLFLFKLRVDHFKILVTFHEICIRLVSNPKYLFVGLCQRFIAFGICQMAHRIVTSIDFYKQFLSAFTSKKITIIPIGSTILPVPFSDEERTQLRHTFTPNNELLLCTFGIRNHDVLFSFFEKMLQQHSQTKFLICGNLKLTDTSRKQYQYLLNHISITGYLSAENVYKHLKISDLFFLPDPVSPNGKGGTSNKSTSLAAAFAADLPIIGIKGDMNNQLLIKNKDLCCHLVSYEALSPSLILETIQNYKTGTNFLFYKKWLSWERIVNLYSDLFK